MKTNHQKIAVNNGQTFLAVPVTGSCNILGIELVLHKAINKAGWSLTDHHTGLAIVAGWNKGGVEGVKAEAQRRIALKGSAAVRSLILQQPAAPPVETLADYVLSPKPTTEKVNVVRIIEALAKATDLPQELVARVIRKSGKHAGRLLDKCPAVFGANADAEAAAVWLGIQPNPFKVSVYKVLSLSGANRDLTLRLSKKMFPAWLDSDKAKLIDLGVW